MPPEMIEPRLSGGLEPALAPRIEPAPADLVRRDAALDGALKRLLAVERPDTDDPRITGSPASSGDCWRVRSTSRGTRFARVRRALSPRALAVLRAPG